MTGPITRRRAMAALASPIVVGTGGRGFARPAGAAGGPPTTDREVPLAYSSGELLERRIRSGTGYDGIPSIDEPIVRKATDPPEQLTDRSLVFGVVRDGVARAYPHYILVRHEIVNDVIAGEPVCVTYCPLTGTTQGYHRGATEFGVTNFLINTNLVMYDRAGETLWPQMLAWGIEGPLAGEFLDEFRVVWTSWERWVAAYPETTVLSEDTGYIRNYGVDPYGSYVPLEGYYAAEHPIIEAIHEPTGDRLHSKEPMLGARTRDGAVVVQKATLRRDGLITNTLGDSWLAWVYDPSLETGWLYRSANEPAIGRAADRYEVDGHTYAPDALPFESVLLVDSMWFAWAGYFPRTTIHGEIVENESASSDDRETPHPPTVPLGDGPELRATESQPLPGFGAIGAAGAIIAAGVWARFQRSRMESAGEPPVGSDGATGERRS